MKVRQSANQFRFNWYNFIWIGTVHLCAITLCWSFFTWQSFFLFLAMVYLTGMVGITFGFHRLLSHKSFKTTSFIEKCAAFCGTLCCQGGPISWVGQHRVHHAFSDQELDPHNIKQGFWHSHIGYIFNRRHDLDNLNEVAHYCPDIAKQRYFWFLEKNMVLIQVAVGIFFGAIGGILGQQRGFDWHSAISFVTWGIFVRLVVVYHITWFVNSATHKWGSRPNKTTDESRNNWWVGILAFGEGWHNNHHAQPRSARHGWEWWQLDQTWILISILKKWGLVSDIKLPNPAQPTAKSSLPVEVTPSSEQALR